MGKTLQYYQANVRERYAAVYNALGSDFPQLVHQMQKMTPVHLEGSLAKYRIRQDHDVAGQIITITYYVYFSKDENGIWKIEKY